MKKPRQKIPKRQQHRLLQVYLHMGQDVAGPLCVKCGLHPGYARGLAQAMGILPPRKLRGGGDIAHRVNHSDPRWKLAVERGAVCT